ncbi:NAD(P)/FAD-dependent oxidoreductase [Arthrobacter sp. 18067]|uniref:flavin-containing monooxygenase n=1 Tax=Arthrobacter sp. 18067 TaxID=2681413 RepID=UPI00135B3DCB|nr:NAD(P)-binding domain-containing protein [Arthrobacter sp. 18067]
MTRYCIIGAGAAGLSAIQQLRQAGYDVVCFEKSDRVGGHWHTDYEALHLITARDMTQFEDFPMPKHYPHFPRRDQVRDYIESYARKNGHYDIIQFNTEVISVTPLPAEGAPGTAGWKVTTSKGTDIYDGVIVANGHLWDKKVPQVRGEFAGKQLHSSEYNNVKDIEGSRVLVVGSGNSGCDLAVDVAQHRLEADIVIRDGVYFQPKTYFGKPRQQLEFLAQFSPSEQDLIARLMARVSIGEWHNYPGMPEPKHRTLAEGRTVVNDLLLYWINHGRVNVVPGIDRFEGNTVHFTDGSAREYDTILWATGFHSSMPFLDDKLVTRRAGAPIRYAAGILPEGLEKLFYVGMIAPRGPQLPIYGLQAKVVARIIALHERAGGRGAGITAYLSNLQDSEDRIDIVRDVWVDQMEDTERLLAAYESVSAAAQAVASGQPVTAGV